MARVLKRATARRDLMEHFIFLAENASLNVARRFLQNVNASFEGLAAMPELGAARTFRSPRFATVRMWPVRGFERYLLFYRPIEEGVEILRVLHGARDIERLFQ